MAHKYVSILLLLCVVFSACRGTYPEQDNVGVIAPYIMEGGVLMFEMGPYKGGTAILSRDTAAFWVKDGVGYTVNDEAKVLAPDLESAPEDILLDESFRAAVE